jgi:hypothetical protein
MVTPYITLYFATREGAWVLRYRLLLGMLFVFA